MFECFHTLTVEGRYPHCPVGKNSGDDAPPCADIGGNNSNRGFSMIFNIHRVGMVPESLLNNKGLSKNVGIVANILDLVFYLESKIRGLQQGCTVI